MDSQDLAAKTTSSLTPHGAIVVEGEFQLPRLFHDCGIGPPAQLKIVKEFASA